MIRFRAVILLAALGLAGCRALNKVDAQLGLVNPQQRSTAGTGDVRQHSGGDAVNVSPSLALTGSGSFAVLAMTLLLWDRRRTRRTLMTVIKAIEDINDASARQVKHEISREALTAGTADYLHRIVKTAQRKLTKTRA